MLKAINELLRLEPDEPQLAQEIADELFTAKAKAAV